MNSDSSAYDGCPAYKIQAMWILLLNSWPDGIVVQRDILYTEHRDPLRSLDIYAPKDCKSCPVIAFVHGGAWKTGDKSNHGIKGLFFAERGFVFVSIDYRTFPDVPFPLFVEDVSDAIAWIHRNIDRYGGDGDRIVLMGHSAGAHIAAMVAYERDFPLRRGIQPETLKGLILLDGAAYDLIELRDSFPMLFDRFIRPIFGEDGQQLREASPIHHIEKGYNPPTLIVHTRRPASISQARRLSERLREAGSQVELYCACDMTHSTVNRHLGIAGNPLNRVILDFLERLPGYILKRSPR